MSTSVTIREARPDEAKILTQIAIDAKKHWGYPEHWIKHWEPDLRITEDFIRNNHVYVAESDGEMCGFYALCVSGPSAELEHMWVAPPYIGTGIGKELFLDAMNRSTSMRIRQVEITSDPNAVGFYKRMGAQQVGEVVSQIDDQLRELPRLKIEPS